MTNGPVRSVGKHCRPTPSVRERGGYGCKLSSHLSRPRKSVGNPFNIRSPERWSQSIEQVEGLLQDWRDSETAAAALTTNQPYSHPEMLHVGCTINLKANKCQISLKGRLQQGLGRPLQGLEQESLRRYGEFT